ncbi:NAD-dependent protein deacetylase of SIR2 family [Actinomadura sp. LD22]|uniref:NAD-dependent protein deacetylase of SIR2 family n=1 Tax=Actinomadura physcomitrii TaxID=2650748 RepID=A0A6I4MPM9_9ACTN|nr:NAD-dependent protein deacetylase of SIR2 family [Actinomadura physcomitrii]MWA05381.1 NAD-dependent protein deacetylase of SIR2 family [Actinomadura physcomitrii]
MMTVAAQVTALEAWLNDADRVLVGAGAGLSAAAGFDYGDTETFARLFPDLARQGFTAQYQMIGRRLPQPQLWGYWYRHVHHMRFADHGPNQIYLGVRDLIGEKDHFVHTSNVDSLFARNGFDPGHVHTPQGDYALLQCTVPCSRRTWPVEPWLRRGLAGLDRASGCVTDADALPRCPTCQGPAFLNVRIDQSFIDDHFGPVRRALNEWIEARRDQKLLILEIGAGFNTPAVVRCPMERLARTSVNTRLVRINRDHPQIPTVLEDRGLSIRADIAEVLDLINIPSRKQKPA